MLVLEGLVGLRELFNFSFFSITDQGTDLDYRDIKLWYIYTMEYYTVIKKNSFESVLMRWMKLEPIIHRDHWKNHSLD